MVIFKRNPCKFICSYCGSKVQANRVTPHYNYVLKDNVYHLACAICRYVKG